MDAFRDNLYGMLLSAQPMTVVTSFEGAPIVSMTLTNTPNHVSYVRFLDDELASKGEEMVFAKKAMELASTAIQVRAPLSPPLHALSSRGRSRRRRRRARKLRRATRPSPRR